MQGDCEKAIFKSITIKGHDLGDKEGKGISGCNEPISSIHFS